MLAVRSVRARMTGPPSGSRSRRCGMMVSASMPRISRGTPGSMATQRCCASSSQMPGADPWRLGRIVQPSGTMACWRLLAGSSCPKRLRHRSSRAARISGSRTIPRPKIEAIAGLVMSSAVGPSPPVVITAPVRSRASCTALAMAVASSPQVARRTMRTPRVANSRARCAALVSIVKPRSSSSPIVTISMFMEETYHERQRRLRPAGRPACRSGAGRATGSTR